METVVSSKCALLSGFLSCATATARRSGFPVHRAPDGAVERRLRLLLGDQVIPLGGDVAQLAQVTAGACRDESADDDVLLEAVERVVLAIDGGIGENARRFLERSRRDERVRLQRGLGDAEQNGLAG